MGCDYGWWCMVMVNVGGDFGWWCTVVMIVGGDCGWWCMLVAIVGCGAVNAVGGAKCWWL